jgi:hypothetical protein
MVDEVEIEKWLKSNYRVEFVNNPFFMDGHRPMQTGAYLIEGKQSLKNIFNEYEKRNEKRNEGNISKLFIFRNAIGNFIFSRLQNDKGMIIRMAIKDGNKRYKLKKQKI